MSALNKGITTKAEKPKEPLQLETSFKQVLESVEKEYHFRIKSIEDLNTHLPKIERVLGKYQPVSMSNIQKTIFHKNPLDFAEYDAAEVYFMDVTVKFPITAYALQLDLVATLDISENFLIVKADNDPREIEGNRLAAVAEINDEHKEDSPASLLSVDSLYPETSLKGELIVGNEYNKKFLEFLSQQSNVRHEASKIKTGSGLFAWLENNEVEPETNDFNKDIKGAPTVANRWDNKGEPKDGRDIDPLITHHGNLDDDAKTYTKRFKKPDGKDVSVTKTVKPIR